ncbi:MAG TPA: hypothetical protein VFJ51_11390, partial [Nitrososphaeraceae archaeon]|nr:hypothetical protein [Nitrososphaeraceae archaeon]
MPYDHKREKVSFNVEKNVREEQDQIQNAIRTTIEKVGIDEISLLQLSDSFFPTGMYTMSNGLETYFYSKKVKGTTQVRDLIKVYLVQQVGPADCVALGNSYQAILN